MRTRKSSSGDTSPMHPYIADFVNQFNTLTEKAIARSGWTTWDNVKKDRNGGVISFKIVTKNV